MFNALFNSLNIDNKIFKLKEANLENFLAEEINNEIAESNEKEVLRFEENKGKKIIVKTFSFQPNLNAYEIIFNNNKEEFKLGLERLKEINEVKIITGKKDKNLYNNLKEFGNVETVKEELDLDKEELILKTYGNNEVVIYDLIEVIKLGKAIKNEEQKEYITIYGSAVEGNKVIAANKEFTYREIFEKLNGKEENLEKVIKNGALNGTPIYNLDLKLGENVKSILFLSKEDLPREERYSCIRCSKCLRTCPKGLNPIKLYELSKRKDREEFIKFGGDKCIECNLCTFVCPSNIELAQEIKTFKIFK